MPEERFEALPPLHGIHVLLVTTNDDTGQLLAVVMEYAGARVTIATSAPAALAALEGTDPDILINDDGGADWLIQRVRSHPQGSEVPAIAVGPRSRPEDRRAALDAGFQAYLSKPVDARELCRIVSTLARRRP